MKSKPLFLLLLAGLSILLSCHVYLIGAYDEVTDQGIQKVQTDVSSLLITLKKNLVNHNATANQYTNFDKTYANIEGEVESLKIRCQALDKYKIILGQIQLVDKNVADLEKLHKLDDFKLISDTSLINNTQSTLEVQFSAMAKLQNALKSEKNQ